MNHKGYTIVELIVVIFLVGLMLFLAVPGMRDVLTGDPLQATARKLAGAARDLRTDAIREQVDHVLHFDLAQNRFWTYTADLTPEKKEERRKQGFVFPAGIRIIDVYRAGGVKRNDGEWETVFYKSGIVQPTVVHLGREGEVVTIFFEPFLSRARIFDRHVEDPGEGGS